MRDEMWDGTDYLYGTDNTMCRCLNRITPKAFK